MLRQHDQQRHRRARAGDAIDAKLFLPNMATEEFLSCLLMAAIEKAAAAEGVKIGWRGKDTRANLIERFKDGNYVYLSALFAPTPDEIADARARRATGTRVAARTTPAAGKGRAPGTTLTSTSRAALTRGRGATATEINCPLPRSDAPAPARCCGPGLLAFKENRP